MNIGIIGTGGVGGYFGGKLTQLLNDNAGLNIYFIARNKHLEEIKKNGLILDTEDEGEMICRPTLATDNFNELPELDLCLICVKSYDLNNVLMQLKSKIKDTTHVLPLLNGIDIQERVRAIIKNGVVYPACAYVGTHIERPGKVTQRGGSCTILFGEDPENACAPPKDICELFDESKIKYKWCDDPFAEIWKKYMFIAAYGMVTASENKTLGQVRDSKELSDKVTGIMKEINAIAKKKAISLPDNIVEESFDNGRNFPYENRTSFQRDFMQKNKPNESELFGDTIIKIGNMMGVSTPVSKTVDEKLKKAKLNE